MVAPGSRLRREWTMATRRRLPNRQAPGAARERGPYGIGFRGQGETAPGGRLAEPRLPCRPAA